MKIVAHWWHQRLTAVALIPLGLWLALSLARLDLASHDAVVTWLSAPMTAILLGLTATCLVYHSWLGVQVVLEDYVGGRALRWSLLLSGFVHLAVVGLCVQAIVSVFFGVP